MLRLQPWTVPVRVTAYSVDPTLKSRSSEPVVPTKLPLAVPRSRNWPVGVVVPCPDMTSAERPVCAVPDEIA